MSGSPIITVNKAWLSKDIENNKTCFSGEYIFRKVTPHSRVGRVMIAVRNVLPSDILKISSELEMI